MEFQAEGQRGHKALQRCMQATQVCLPGLNHKRVYRSVLVGWGFDASHLVHSRRIGIIRRAHDLLHPIMGSRWFGFEGVHCVRACTAFISLRNPFHLAFSRNQLHYPQPPPFPRLVTFTWHLLVGAPLKPSSYLPQASPLSSSALPSGDKDADHESSTIA